ncbi:MAG: hypothetical protein M1607_00540 [Patescibacteria group bacterium]|nr:hypothetical protein [Patescibacteria group bacterium]
MDEDSVAANASDNPINQDNRASIVLDLERLIKSHLTNIDQLRDELEKQQGLLDDIFNNDATYKEHTEQAKEAARVKSATKQQILKQPQAADLSNRVKTLKSELKELQGALSDYLQEYRRMSGASEIEDDNGEVREIVYTAKLVRRLDKFNK